MRSFRANLFLHVKNLLPRLNLDLANVSFEEVRNLLVERNLVLANIEADRFAAMVLSYARGYTTDEDARW